MSHQSNILLIEDNPDDQFLLSEELSDTVITNNNLEIASTLKEGISKLNRNKPDVVLLDLSLPDSFGLEGLNKIKAMGMDMPVIIFTGLHDNLIALDAIKNGAQDYLVKGKYTKEQLERTIRYALQRKHSLDQLRKSDKKFRSYAENAPNLILEVDEKGVIQYLNRGIQGLPKKEAIGKSMFSFIEKKHRVDALKRLRNVFEQGVSETYEAQGIGPNGTISWYQSNMGPITGDDGKVESVIIIAQDITNQKNAQILSENEHNQAIQYQSMLLSSQINPHFIFNALNSIQYYILHESVEPALEFISEFSKLMRSVLGNSLHEQISISDEVDFLELYLDLEQKRYGDKFEYEIIVDERLDTDELQIAPMLLQPYVENTVVHGVGNLPSGGLISIRFFEEEGCVKCTIMDNGVGRKRAEELKQLRIGGQRHQSMGMGITGTRLNLLNALGKGRFDVEVEDLAGEDDQPKGTRITVTFPMWVV